MHFVKAHSDLLRNGKTSCLKLYSRHLSALLSLMVSPSEVGCIPVGTATYSAAFCLLPEKVSFVETKQEITDKTDGDMELPSDGKTVFP